MRKKNFLMLEFFLHICVVPSKYVCDYLLKKNCLLCT